jgi:hypothetical protein
MGLILATVFGTALGIVLAIIVAKNDKRSD